MPLCSRSQRLNAGIDAWRSFFEAVRVPQTPAFGDDNHHDVSCLDPLPFSLCQMPAFTGLFIYTICLVFIEIQWKRALFINTWAYCKMCILAAFHLEILFVLNYIYIYIYSIFINLASMLEAFNIYISWSMCSLSFAFALVAQFYYI